MHEYRANGAGVSHMDTALPGSWEETICISDSSKDCLALCLHVEALVDLGLQLNLFVLS